MGWFRWTFLGLSLWLEIDSRKCMADDDGDCGTF